MKKLIYLSLALIIVACNRKEKSGSTVTITGTIENPATDHIFIKGIKEIGSAVVDSILVDRDACYVISFAIIDKNGNFSTSFQTDEPGYFKFFHGREYAGMFLSPGDNIQLKLDAEEFDETISYSGTGSVPNGFLASRLLLSEKLEKNQRELYSLDVDRFIIETDSAKKVLEDHLQAFLDSALNINEKFKKIEQARIIYEWTDKRSKYPEYHKYYANKDSVDLDEDYYNYMSDVDLNDPELLTLSPYTGTLNAYLEKKASEELEKDSGLKETEIGRASCRERV